MASQGPNGPSSITTVQGSGSAIASWGNLSNASSSDNTYAVSGGPLVTSWYLVVKNFGFSIPSGATIDGIVVEVERKADAGFSIIDSSSQTNAFKLLKSGSAVGNSKRDSVNYWPTSDTYKTYGGDSDLWGTTWTDSDINNVDFGLQLAFDNESKSNIIGYVDYVRITVYYTEAAGGGQPYIGRVSGVPGARLGGASFGRGW